MVALQRVIGSYGRFDDVTAAIATVLREQWAINVDRKGLVGAPENKVRKRRRPRKARI